MRSAAAMPFGYNPIKVMPTHSNSYGLVIIEGKVLGVDVVGRSHGKLILPVLHVQGDVRGDCRKILDALLSVLLQHLHELHDAILEGRIDVALVLHLVRDHLVDVAEVVEGWQRRRVHDQSAVVSPLGGRLVRIQIAMLRVQCVYVWRDGTCVCVSQSIVGICAKMKGQGGSSGHRQ